MSTGLAQLPPLDLLRGFVAVARRLSITQAAADLFLTQSAISRQVRALEDHLGTPLFVRHHRALSLTPAGDRLFRQTDAWLLQLADLTDSLRQGGATPPVTVTATIGVVSLWLLPRLGDFQALHPGIDVRVSAGNRRIDLVHEGVDLALRYGPASRAAAGATLLFDEQLVPVASPALGLAPVLEDNALARLTLLEHDDVAHPGLQWADWLAALGLADAPRGRLGFNQADQVIYAALAGHGVALGRLPLVAPMLADGRLVRLALRGQTPTTDYGYWLLRRPGPASAARQYLDDWLLLQAEATRQQVAALAAGVA